MSNSASSTRKWAEVCFVAGLCGVLGFFRWVKMDTLVWGDTPRWLFEAQRVAAGELPYRDFSWNYPPLQVLLLGWLFRYFGVRFSVAQIFIYIVSLGVVISVCFMARELLPRFLLLPVLFCFIAVCGTSLMFFNLFSLLTYVPALQTGVCGFLLFLLGILKYVREGRIKDATWITIGLGAFTAACSKPETLAATYTTLVVLAIVDRTYWFRGQSFKSWLSHYAKLGLVCVGPAVAAYIWMGSASGFGNMVAGITGYGLAGDICPWWPTGLGVFGALSSLSEAAFVVAVLSLLCRERAVARFGRRYYHALFCCVTGIVIYIAYLIFNNWALFTGNRSIAAKIWYSGPTTFWTSAILLPVMWSCVIVWVYLVVRYVRWGRRLSAEHFLVLVLLTGPVTMSARGWFNWNLETRTAVPGVCYPFFLILGPYLLWRALQLINSGPSAQPELQPRVGMVITILLIGYGSLRIVAAYPHLLSDKSYHVMSTLAGDVRLTDRETNWEIYRFVLENTASSDTVLDIPYGGGINFAARRLSPLFETQFQQLSMPEKYLERDLEAIRRHPPKIVIAENQPHYGVSYGLRSNSCPFPHLVWSPETGTFDDRVLPAIAYIEQNYRKAKIVGDKILLVAK